MTKKQSILFILFFFGLVTIIAGCSADNDDTPDQEKTNQDQAEDTEQNDNGHLNQEENPVVTITMDNDAEIIIELYPDIAPNTVNNFIFLIEDGFYDGLIFHRVIPDFMIQGGDPDGNGTGGPGYSIAGEFDANGFSNDLKHTRGVISMARSESPDSAGSQFFIMVKDADHLDDDYAAFGEVVEGMSTVDEIVSAERDSHDKPLEDQIIKQIEVDTKGHDYDEPEIIDDES